MVKPSNPQNRNIGVIPFLGHIWILRVCKLYVWKLASAWKDPWMVDLHVPTIKSSWWLNQPNWKRCSSKLGILLHNFRGENTKNKYLSCHHPEIHIWYIFTYIYHRKSRTHPFHVGKCTIVPWIHLHMSPLFSSQVGPVGGTLSDSFKDRRILCQNATLSFY